MSRHSEAVREFHEAFGHPVATVPGMVDASLRRLRADLILEELTELAVAFRLRQDGDRFLDGRDTPIGSRLSLVDAADALADLLYVVHGAALVLGIDLDPVFEEVHRSNMSKLGADGKPVLREDGKILKGPGYSPPDLWPILLEQSWRA